MVDRSVAQDDGDHYCDVMGSCKSQAHLKGDAKHEHYFIDITLMLYQDVRNMY